jgi:hypothetical protein
MGTSVTGWTTSDFNYLMYKDQKQVDFQTTTPTMAAYFANFAYDSNYLGSLLMTLIFCGLDVAVIVLSWGPFTKFYNLKVAEKQYLSLTYDSNGCD